MRRRRTTAGAAVGTVGEENSLAPLALGVLQADWIQIAVYSSIAHAIF
jgi:hypothetical protein